MMRKILAFITILFLPGCEKNQWDDCFTSTGAMSSIERMTEGFYGIELHDRVDLVLEERVENTIEIHAGRNLVDQVETEVQNGWLTIRNNNSCNWVRSFKPRITVKVPVDQVSFLMLKGTGNVSASTTISKSTFRIEQAGAQGTARLDLDVDTCFAGLHSGAGDVIYTGNAKFAYLYSGIMGPIDASGLDADVVYVNNSGVADIHCHARVFLDVQIYDAGDVYYSGEPALTIQILGSGQLHHLD